jgi:hypothetical protein
MILSKNYVLALMIAVFLASSGGDVRVVFGGSVNRFRRVAITRGQARGGDKVLAQCSAAGLGPRPAEDGRPQGAGEKIAAVLGGFASCAAMLLCHVPEEIRLNFVYHLR